MRTYSKVKKTFAESIGAVGFGDFLNRFRVKTKTMYLPVDYQKAKEQVANAYETDTDSSLAILNEFKNTIEGQAELYEKLDTVKWTGVVQTIYDIFYTDFVSSNKSNVIFNAKYQGSDNEDFDKFVNEKISKSIKKLKLRKLVKTMAKDFFHRGNYYLRPVLDEEKKQGILSLHDDVISENITPLYRGMDKIGFIEAKGLDLKTYAKHDFVHFCLDNEGVIQIKKFDKHFIDVDVIPEYLKIGRPLIFSSVAEIKELELYRTAMIALDLKELLSPVFIMLGMSEKMTWEEGLKATKSYENMFTDALRSVGSTMMSVRDMLKQAIRFKVLPSLGGRGQVTTLDISKNREMAIERLKQLKKEVAAHIGFPSYYLLGTDDTAQVNEHKIANMKIQSRYLHKGLAIQSAIVEGIKEIIYLDLLYQGIKIDIDNIFVSMEEVVNVELIDKLEYMIGVLESEEKLLTFLNEVESSRFNVGVSDHEYFEHLKRTFSSIPGAENLFIKKEKYPQNMEQTKEEQLNKIVELFIPSKGEYQNRAGSFNKSIAQKTAWKTNRFMYMKGIKKFNRLQTLSKMKKKIFDNLNNGTVKKADGYFLNITANEKIDFLENLGLIRVAVINDFEKTSFNEDKENYSFFVDKMLEAVNDFENNICSSVPINEDNLCFIQEIFSLDNIEEVA